MNPDLDTLVTSHPLELTIWHLAPSTWHLFRVYSITGNPAIQIMTTAGTTTTDHGHRI